LIFMPFEVFVTRVGRLLTAMSTSPGKPAVSAVETMLGMDGVLPLPILPRPVRIPLVMSVGLSAVPPPVVGVGVGVGVGVVDERGVVWAGTYMGSPVRLSTMEA